MNQMIAICVTYYCKYICMYVAIHECTLDAVHRLFCVFPYMHKLHTYVIQCSGDTVVYPYTSGYNIIIYTSI